METKSEQLHELVQASIDSIEENIESVEKLPIEEAYKKELSSILKKIHGSISAAKPILSHLDQVRGLVINPIQEGVDKAFNESNKWGILGLKVSIASLLITVVFGLFGSKIPWVGGLFENSISDSDIKIIKDDPVCSSPKISRILKPFDAGQQDILYISGECFRTNNVQFSGINMTATRINESLLTVVTRNAVSTGKGNVISVLNYNSDFENGSDVKRTSTRIDIETMTIYGGKTLKDEQLSDYRASFELAINAPQIVTIWQTEQPIHIGGEPKYILEKK